MFSLKQNQNRSSILSVKIICQFKKRRLNLINRLFRIIIKHSLAVWLGFLTKFRFAKISRNWLRNDFRVSRKWGTSFASFAVSRNCRDYERNDFRETRKSRKWRKLGVKIQNLTFFLSLVKMPAEGCSNQNLMALNVNH